jgi:hypothetical protein
MPSPKIIEIEQTLQTCSLEDRQWLLQQLIQQLKLNEPEKLTLNYKQQAQEIMAETITEVVALSDDCEDELWQKFDLASSKIAQQLNELD